MREERRLRSKSEGGGSDQLLLLLLLLLYCNRLLVPMNKYTHQTELSTFLLAYDSFNN